MSVGRASTAWKGLEDTDSMPSSSLYHLSASVEPSRSFADATASRRFWAWLWVIIVRMAVQVWPM